jgi:hypothetical protein
MILKNHWPNLLGLCHFPLRLRESSKFCYLKLKLQVKKVTDVCTI